jgi:hypothetical protein
MEWSMARAACDASQAVWLAGRFRIARLHGLFAVPLVTSWEKETSRFRSFFFPE